MNTSTISKPWYRHGMVWMLIAIPATAVVMGIAMLTVAVTTWDGLVMDDYYKHGKEINRVLVRDRFATENGLAAHLAYTSGDGRVIVSVDARRPVEPVQTLTLMFLHPTRSGLDRRIELARGADGKYHGLMPALVEGGWHVQIGTGEWRLGVRTEVSPGEALAVAFTSLPGG